MDLLIANVSQVVFKIDKDLSEQYGALPLPFPGMDKSTAAVCQFFNGIDGMDGCDKGVNCAFRHIRGDRTIVCKHWLRGLCKKGDQCEFLHEYDMTKMPECYFYSRFHACHNKECPFLHIDPESKIKDCPWYDRGFCRHGPHCRHRHVRRILCTNYLAGFCPDGSNCKYMHPRFELPPPPEIPKDQIMKRAPTCHFCGEVGHKASYCQKISPEQREAHMKKEENKFNMNAGFIHSKPGGMDDSMTGLGSAGQPPRLPPKPIEEITCFKCGNKGHYANKCPKGHLAFLSHSNNMMMNANNGNNNSHYNNNPGINANKKL